MSTNESERCSSIGKNYANEIKVCDSCSGEHQSESASILEVHHTIPVSIKGNDDNNILLVCPRYHGGGNRW